MSGYIMRHIIDIGEDTRIHELMVTYSKLWALTGGNSRANTWGGLFNTKTYQKRLALRKKILDHVNWIVKTDLLPRMKEQYGIDVATWETKWVGSVRYMDLLNGENQKYRVVCFRYNLDS